METLIRGVLIFFKGKKTKNKQKNNVLSSLSCVPLILFKNLWFDLNLSVLLLKEGSRVGLKNSLFPLSILP